MNNTMNEFENYTFINDLNEKISFYQNEELNSDSSFERIFKWNCVNIPNLLLDKKRIKNSNDNYNQKPVKFRNDNLIRKCKHLIIENIMNFINEKIYKVYEGNIGNGLTKKRLLKMNQSQKLNSNVEFNKKFIMKSLKEIFSQNITQQINLYDPDHNKKLIDTLLSEKKDEFEKLFNLNFIECVEHFVEEKQIEELRGLRLFSELKEKIIRRYEKDGESYYENLKSFLKEFKNRINKAKPRKKRKKNNLSDAFFNKNYKQ